MRKMLIFIIMFSLAISGCGYTAKSLLPSHLNTIYIEPFKSKIDIARELEYSDHYSIYRTGLEREVTEEVKSRFIYDGSLKVVNNKDEADSVLSCQIIDFAKEPLRYTDGKEVDEYRMKIVVDIKFRDLVMDELIVNQPDLAGEAEYSRTGEFAKSESTAQKEAIQDLARRIVEKVTEAGW